MNKIKSLKIKDDIFFNILPCFTKQWKIANSFQHQIILLDRSGSMDYEINNVINSVIEYCYTLPEESLVSLGYFSGMGQYNLTVPYTFKKEVSGCITMLNSYRSVMGLTNFIEILNKVKNSLKENMNNNLFFFSDGMHNTGGSKNEIISIFNEIRDKLQVAIFVGCGYIDRDFMSLMASSVDGSFIHLSNFTGFKSTLTDFGASVEESAPSVEVPIDFTDEDIIPISIKGKSVIEYSVENNKIKYRPSKRDFQGIYFLTQNKIKSAEVVNEIDITTERGIRALAMLYSQKNEVDTALELLSFIGDKYLIQNLYSAITADEFSLAEEKIRKSVFVPNERFLEGKVKDFLPNSNAFCVLDAVNILCADEDAKVYLHDKDFDYVKIGKSQKQTDGPMIEYDKDAGSRLGDIVMHKERLNLNIRVFTKGIVPLVPAYFKNNPFLVNELDALNIPKEYPVNVIRTYNLVCDGRLQTKKLVVSDLKKDTINKLGAIITRRADKKYVIDFTSLPVISKAHVKNTSAVELAKTVWEEKLLMDRISYYNYLKKETEAELGIKFKKEYGLVLSDEACEFLEEHCYIKGDSFSPPHEPVTETDEYQAYTISIDIKGFSKVAPKEVAAKLIAGKKCTDRELTIKECFDKQEFFGKGEERLQNLDKEIKELNAELWPIRKQVQLAKFAVILGNRGKFDEFKERGKNSLKVSVKSLDGVSLLPEFIFDVSQIVVKL